MMEVTKEQIAKGVAKFIQEDMIPHISDSGMQLILGVTAGAVETRPNILDKLLSNEMLEAVAKSGNNYDLSLIKNVAASAIEKYGKLSITIPGIKFISPGEKVLQFGEGGFLRAFVDYFFDLANERHGFNGKVAIVQPIAQGLTDMVNAQEGLYTLYLRGFIGDYISI